MRAGADMATIDASTWQPVVDALVQALRDGDIPRARANESVSRVLAAKGATVCSS